MTISNKLLIITTLALGISQFGFAHNAHTWGHATPQFFNFTQALRQVNHKDAIKIAQWLEQQVQVWNKSYNPCDHDYDIGTIINILNDNKLNIESKISKLSQAMADQKQRNSVIGTIRNSLVMAWATITGNNAL
jgi:hypothetical protein